MSKNRTEWNKETGPQDGKVSRVESIGKQQPITEQSIGRQTDYMETRNGPYVDKTSTKRRVDAGQGKKSVRRMVRVEQEKDRYNRRR